MSSYLGVGSAGVLVDAEDVVRPSGDAVLDLVVDTPVAVHRLHL